MELLSIIVPCYNEEETLDDYYQAIRPIRNILLERSCAVEVILVNDGSSDGTLEKMKLLSRCIPWIRYISLTRNFGKEAAMYAGLQHAKGDYVCVMDVDLQDPPELIPQMLEILHQEPYDCVGTRRVNRKGEPAIRSLFARMFYKLMRKISDVEIVDGARDYRLMTRRYVNSLLELQEYNRFSKGLFGWVGYRTKWLEYENVKRRKGETKWSFSKLFTYSIDGIVDFSTIPVHFASWVGMMFCALAFVFIVVIIVRTLLFGDPVAGWPSLVCIILLLSGIQLFCLGIMGEYISKTYLEVKKRPIYLCSETNVDEEVCLIPELLEADATGENWGTDKKGRGKKKKDKKAQGKKKDKSGASEENHDIKLPDYHRTVNLEKYGWKDEEAEDDCLESAVWENGGWVTDGGLQADEPGPDDMLRKTANPGGEGDVLKKTADSHGEDDMLSETADRDEEDDMLSETEDSDEEEDIQEEDEEFEAMKRRYNV